MKLRPYTNANFMRYYDVVCHGRGLNDNEKQKVSTPLYKWLWNKARTYSNDHKIIIEYMECKKAEDVNVVYIEDFIGYRETQNLLMEIRYIQNLTKDIDNNPLKPTLL